MAISDLDKLNTLNSVFHNVFTTDNGQDLHLNELCNITKMNDIEVTANNITTTLANMSNKISRTPDEIPAFFLSKLLLGLLMYYAICINLVLALPRYHINGSKH